MKAWLGVVLAVPVVALAATAAGAAPATTTALHPLRTGIAYTAADDAHEDLALARVRGAGASTYRLTLDWSTVAPARRPSNFDPANPDDPAYDWSAFDKELRSVVAAGLTPLVAIYRAPVWARASDSDSAGPVSGDLHDFAVAAARRYNGETSGEPAVRQWLVWLEPNVNIWFSPQFDGHNRPVSPSAYRADVNAMTAAVRQANAANLVVAGGLSPFTVSSGATRTIGPMDFMRRLLCMSAGAHPEPTCSARVSFDVWSHDPYTSGGPTHKALNPNDVSLGDLGKMRTLLYAAVAAHHVVSRHPVKFWVTEFSWDSNPPDRLGLPLGLHARWTAEALYRIWTYGIDEVIWLSLRDNQYPSDPVQAGLYFRGAPTTKDDRTAPVTTDRAKPALVAFRFPFVAYPERAGVLVWGRTPTSAPGAVRIERRAGSTWQRVAVVQAGRYGVFRTTVAPQSPTTSLRAVADSTSSLPFSLTAPADRFVHPFG